ncbi:hypothetical protein H5410_040104 [Solanum commersonii]|uniref:Uncharacterized protein n=1 Tax=Solanum commersonii TaxID=4109 RepID=A0A9J5XRJ1_SOLCO|nr:hypothetical protein H5410_040104 [Solanum commersonii]
MIDKDVTHGIKTGWLKWKCDIGVLCDKRMPIKEESKFYRASIRPIMLYGVNDWLLRSSISIKCCRNMDVMMHVWSYQIT